MSSLHPMDAVDKLCAIGAFVATAALWTLGWLLDRRARPEVLPEPSKDCLRNSTECVP